MNPIVCIRGKGLLKSESTPFENHVLVLSEDVNLKPDSLIDWNIYMIKTSVPFLHFWFCIIWLNVWYSWSHVSAAHQRTEESVQSRDLPPNSSYQRISEPVASSQVSPVLQLQAAMLQKASSQECSNHDEVVTLPIPAPVRGYQCQFCFKLFRHVSNFKSHQLIHTNLKPYKCRFCGVGFKQTGNLKAHERIHTGDRPYKCSYCGKQFARSTTRNTHEKLHTNSVTYRCNVCDRIFMHANSLKKHQMLHKT